jgi:hypothetical protein
MVSPASNVTQTQPAAQSTGPSIKKPAQPEHQSAPSTDSVQLSPLAQSLATARQEAVETSFQTSTEASRGDLQAQRLLAKEAAAQPVAK